MGPCHGACGFEVIEMISKSLLILGPLVTIEAFCEVYMSETQATAVLFPGVKFEKSQLELTREEQKKIADLSGENVRWNKSNVWRAESGEWVFIDRVLGKHEYITYAVGIGSDGKVRGIEILEYKESFGHEVRGQNWRAQFVGKDKSSPLKLDNDIKNISGATLSSAHISAGVRRILQTYEVLKQRI